MQEDGVLRGLGPRGDATPDGELRGGLTVLAVPARERAQRLDVVVGARGREQILDGLRPHAERAPDMRPRRARGTQIRHVLERDAVDALGFAEVTAPCAERAEAEVGLVAQRVERESLHVATEGHLLLVRELVAARDADELEGARRMRRPRAAEERPDEGDSAGGGGQRGQDTPHRHQLSARPRVFAIVGGVSGPRQLDVVATVESPDVIVSPFTGERAAFFHVEMVEVVTGGAEHSLGEVMIGDVVLLHVAELGTDVAVVVRRAVMRLVGPRGAGVPLDSLPRPPPEAIPLLGRARGRGAPCFREHAVRRGAALRLRAIVDAGGAGGAGGAAGAAAAPEAYSGSSVVRPLRLVVRDDLAPVTLDEVLAGA